MHGQCSGHDVRMALPLPVAALDIGEQESTPKRHRLVRRVGDRYGLVDVDLRPPIDLFGTILPKIRESFTVVSSAAIRATMRAAVTGSWPYAVLSFANRPNVVHLRKECPMNGRTGFPDAAWIAVGAGVGLVLGILFDHLVWGLLIGAALGVVTMAVQRSRHAG